MKLMTTRAAVPIEYTRALNEQYDAQVAAVDARVGEIVAGLARRGALETTLLVVVADHGEGFENGELGTHALVSRQSTLHVPMIVAGPKASGGRAIDDVVELVDLCPTILGAFAVAPPDGIAGKSLWPLIDGSATGWDDVSFATLPVSAEPGAAKSLPKTLTVWTGRFKLVVKNPGPNATVALRDLEADPDENQDFRQQHPDVARALLKRLDQWIERTRRASLAGVPIGEDASKQIEQLGYGK
jgi:arylsulfatase A-like enzyme